MQCVGFIEIKDTYIGKKKYIYNLTNLYLIYTQFILDLQHIYGETQCHAMILIQDNIGMNYLKDNTNKSKNSYVTFNLICKNNYFSNVRKITLISLRVPM